MNENQTTKVKNNRQKFSLKTQEYKSRFTEAEDTGQKIYSHQVIMKLLLVATFVACSFFLATDAEKKVVCYYGSWAVYRPGEGKFDVEDFDPYICTHAVYGFAGLSFDNKIRALDEWNDLFDNYGKGAFIRFNNLKKINPKLKTILAIGGWNEGSTKYSAMASNPGSRKIFVDSVVVFLQKYGFDGLDMDWEYPANRGGKPEDKQNFVSLLKELHEAFQPHGLLLTAATSAGKATIDTAYDIAQMSKYLDIINLMAYDYHGAWETFTGVNSPLYAHPDETPEQKLLNANFSVNYWIEKGADKSKIVLGMGLYGRAFTLQSASNHGLYAPAPQAGQAGPYTREPGTLGYNEICENKQWNVVWDDDYKVPYAYHDRQWVGFDDPKSIKIKCDYINSMGLGGGMVWSIETDDFRGKCHGTKFALLTVIHETLIGPIVRPPPPTTQSPDPTAPTTPTVQPPTQSTPSPDPNIKCNQEGWFRDPKNCAHYWWCYKLGNDLKVQEFYCQDGTSFDPNTITCQPQVQGC